MSLLFDPASLVQILLLGLASGGAYALIASGMTLVWSVTKQINVVHGDFLIISMFGCYSIYLSLRLDPYVAIIITAPAMFILGLLIFHFLFKPIMDKSGGLTPFVAFLGMAYALESLLSLFFGADNISTVSQFQGYKLSLGSLRLPVTYLVALLVSIVVSLGFHRLLSGTDFGRAVRAIAENSAQASLQGINVKRIQMLVFAMAFVLLALAGSLLMPIWSINAFMGLSYTLFAFIILAMGGMGSFVGSLVAAIILGLLESYSNYFLGPALAPTIPYAVFVLILLFKPNGLFSTK
ncbi:MAG: branched-chain amino acid ABC transporter permease [Dehalococcoidales bacterium]|nr:branched-chain amino acid ABC transporter permease [Dehalococcoidales bacterium]